MLDLTRKQEQSMKNAGAILAGILIGKKTLANQKPVISGAVTLAGLASLFSNKLPEELSMAMVSAGVSGAVNNAELIKKLPVLGVEGAVKVGEGDQARTLRGLDGEVVEDDDGNVYLLDGVNEPQLLRDANGNMYQVGGIEEMAGVEDEEDFLEGLEGDEEEDDFLEGLNGEEEFEEDFLDGTQEKDLTSMV